MRHAELVGEGALRPNTERASRRRLISAICASDNLRLLISNAAPSSAFKRNARKPF